MKKTTFDLFRFAHVTQDNISIVFFDSHGSTGQDESYLKNQPDWFERQYDDYIKVAQYEKLLKHIYSNEFSLDILNGMKKNLMEH
jgi:hypothetical protein